LFLILRTWASQARTATTDELIALAEQVSGAQLDDLFAAWLSSGGKRLGDDPEHRRR
jgi:hypothetical protein